MIFIFWMLSFKPTFSLSSFTFIKRLFSSSSLSAIRIVSSAYLRLVIFLLAILIPVCACTSHVAIMHWSRGWSYTDHVTDHAQITWLSCTDYLIVHAINTWMIMHLSRGWSCTNHIADHELITWLSMQWSRVGMVLIMWLIMSWSRGYHGLMMCLRRQ